MLDEAVSAEYAAEVEQRAKQGKRFSIALDEVLKEKLDPKMHASDKLAAREDVLNFINKKKAEQIALGRAKKPEPIPAPKRVIPPRTSIPFTGGRIPARSFDFKEFQSGEAAEARRDQVAIEISQHSPDQKKVG